MFVAVRLEPNGKIYLVKDLYSRTQEIQDEQGNITIQPLFAEEVLSQPPYNYTKVEIDDKYFDCIGADFNEDLTFNVEKYNARKQEENARQYEELIVSKIRKRYTINQELAILRQQTTKPIEYQEYFDYVELCKVEAKSEVFNENNTIIR